MVMLMKYDSSCTTQFFIPEKLAEFLRGGAGAGRGVHPSGPILPSVLTALDWMHRFAAKVANSAPTGMSATATSNPA